MPSSDSSSRPLLAGPRPRNIMPRIPSIFRSALMLALINALYAYPRTLTFGYLYCLRCILYPRVRDVFPKAEVFLVESLREWQL